MRAALCATRLWLERIVIGLSLCPWSRAVHEAGTIRFACTGAADSAALAEAVVKEVAMLQEAPPSKIETTILTAPRAFPEDFASFNEFTLDVEQWLQQQSLDDVFQVVAFHPQFMFAGEAADDASNSVNRSPHPTLHLLRQDSVTAAIDAQPQLAVTVPSSNSARVRSLGAATMSKLVTTALVDGIAEAEAHSGPSSQQAINEIPPGG